MTPAARQNRIAVLADDLTGALASATNLRLAGVRAKVVWRIIPEEIGGGLVIDMRSRDQGDGVPRIEEYVRELRQRGTFDYELRVDSTLRGQPAASLNALVAAADLGEAVQLAIPAYPGAGRTTRNGVQQVRLSDGSTTEIPVAERLFPGREIAVIATGRDAETSPVEQLSTAVAAGRRHLIADAEDEEDLQTTAQAVAALRTQGVPVVTISPGAWLRYAAKPRRFMVVVVASITPPLDEQLQALRGRAGVIAVTPEGADSLMPTDLPDGTTVVIETTSLDSPPHSDDAGQRNDIAADAARSAKSLIARAETAGCYCHSVLASGGWAAAMVLDALGADMLAPQDPVAPLCSHSTVRGGDYDGMDFYAKGGSIGTAETLTEIVDSAWRRNG